MGEIELGARFEDLVVRLLGRNGFEITQPSEESSEHMAIIASQSNGTGEKLAISVKFYRSPRVSPSLLRNAMEQLVGQVIPSTFRRILMVNVVINRAQSLTAKRLGIEIWDARKLEGLSLPFPVFRREYDELQNEGLSVSGAGLLNLEMELSNEASTGGDQESKFEVAPSLRGHGRELVQRLKATAAGRQSGAAQIFEDLCQQALEYIFSGAFVSWRNQGPIDDGFHRTDLIARIVNHDVGFWGAISADFGTRYVVFEFKNYNDEIRQDQIYSTEKYLFTTALRSVALIVARSGVSQSAKKAIVGALREQGKLILTITGPELCELLEAYDDGDDPNDFLFRKLDDLLMSTGR